MKRLFTFIASLFGLSGASQAQTQMVNPQTLLYSIATINDALPVTDSVPPKNGDFIIHEDDWRQFEAVSRTLESDIEKEQGAIKQIFEEKSKPVGEYRAFTDIHVRELLASPLPTPVSWTDLLSAVDVQNSGISRVGLRNGQGMVRDGFSFRVGQFTIFGIRHEDCVAILSFALTRTPGLSKDQAQRLAAFFEKNNLVLVHWPSATVFREKQELIDFLQQNNEKQR